MTRTFTRKALLILLALMAALQPLLALGETSMGQANDQQPGQPSDMACGSMSAQDCTLAASLGSCSALVVMVPPEGNNTPAFSTTHQTSPRPHDGYQSIVLDTLTPPPNASIA